MQIRSSAFLLALAAAGVSAAPVTFDAPSVDVISTVKASPLAPGECTSYEIGEANAVLCLQEAKLTAPNSLLLVGFLYNNGTTEICDLKLAPLNAPGMTAFWPDWAAGLGYEKFFNLKQMASVGLTALPNGDNTLPSIEITSFHACTEGTEPAKTNLVLTRKIAIAESTMMPPTEEEVPAGVEALEPTEPAARKLAAPTADQEEAQLFFNGPLSEGECAIYNNGTASLTLCLESHTQASGSLSLLKGFLYNNGTAPLCNVRVRVVNAPGLIEQWPDWSPTSAYEKYFNPKQVTSVGATLMPNVDGSAPSLEVFSFHTCSEEAIPSQVTIRKQPIDSLTLPLPEAEVPAVLNGGIAEKRKLAVEVHPSGPIAYQLDARFNSNNDKAQKAFKPGYDVTQDEDYQDGVEVPPLRDDYEICKRFESYDPSLEITVCLENAKTWHDKKRGRVVSTDLAVLNTGMQGVCNLTVYIEGMENELEHFPQLIDDNGFDTYPKFVSWYAPGRITNMGSAIPKAKGVPRFTVLKNFVACDEPDANIIHRKFRCTESTRKPNAAVKVCVYSDLKEWSDNDGNRVVAVEGFLSNTGGASLCNLTVDITNFENVQGFWGDWMPTFPYYLDEASTLKFAANIPYVKGFPKVSLKKYSICPHKVEEPKTTIPKAEAIEAGATPKGPAAGPGGVAPIADGAAGPAVPATPTDPAAVPPAPVDAPAAEAAAPVADAAPALDTPAVEAPTLPEAPAADAAGFEAPPAPEAPAAPVAEGVAPARRLRNK